MKKTFTADFEASKAPANPRGYFVPDFGIDQDIKNVKSSIASTEQKLKTKWNPKQDANGAWNMPEAASADSYGYNKLQYINNSGLVQLDAEVESDPICASSGCDQYKHPEAPEEPPRDYFVPDFGVDHDILHS